MKIKRAVEPYKAVLKRWDLVAIPATCTAIEYLASYASVSGLKEPGATTIGTAFTAPVVIGAVMSGGCALAFNKAVRPPHGPLNKDQQRLLAPLWKPSVEATVLPTMIAYGAGVLGAGTSFAVGAVAATAGVWYGVKRINSAVAISDRLRTQLPPRPPVAKKAPEQS